MMTKTAPDLTPGYPSKGPQIGPAWIDIWRALGRAGDEYQDGTELAAKYAAKYDLAPATLVALISRAAKAGFLEKELRSVDSGRGPRTRSFYRIKDGV
jgi:hypothetical protein